MYNIIYLSSDKIFGPTLEGEGRYAGYPAIFMRLAMCNLTCKGFASTDSPHGCDSFISWSVKNKFTFEELYDYFKRNNFIEELKRNTILKVSGGEPFLQQKSLIKFIDYFIDKIGFTPKIDFETNGTILPDPYWLNVKATFTTSPKLMSNGDPESKRYKPEVLKELVKLNACFKFVVQSEDDIKEIIDKYIKEPKINLPTELIWLMPCCGSRKEQDEKSLLVAELCKKYNFKFSPRLHLLIWDKALLV